jgi:predicted nucleic acid-binding protein
MKRVFLDTNILIDYYDNRSGAAEADILFRIAQTGTITIFASILTFANFAYIARHNHTKEQVYLELDRLERLISVLPMDKRQLRNAIDHPCKDFEDMLQYQCAVANGCDVIITNNKKDFVEYSHIPIYTAAEYLNDLKKKG